MSAVFDYVCLHVGNLRQPAPILDVGCGNGDLLQMFHAWGYHQELLCGFDIEPGHVAVAKERTGLEQIYVARAECLTVQQLPWPPAWRNPAYVTAINWMHDDWAANHATGIPAEPGRPPTNRFAAYIRALSGLLEPGGRLIFDKPDPAPYWEILRDFRLGERWESPAGFYVFTKLNS